MYNEDTIECDAVANQNDRMAIAKRIAEVDNQGVQVIAVAPKVWGFGELALCWWPRRGGEYVTWNVHERGFESGEYYGPCSEKEAWELFYKRLMD